MHVGLTMFPTDYAIPPHDLAVAAEARGFESLWLPEHTHIPTSRRSPWPGGPVLPREYSHTHDLFVALATAAAVTTRLRVASGICLLVERDPIITAKEVASLDVLSNGGCPASLGVSVYAARMDATTGGALRDAGVQRVIFSLPSKGRDELLPLLDRGAAVMRSFA